MNLNLIYETYQRGCRTKKIGVSHISIHNQDLGPERFSQYFRAYVMGKNILIFYQGKGQNRYFLVVQNVY